MIGLKGGEAANTGHVTCIEWTSFKHSVPRGFAVFWRLDIQTMGIRTVSGMTLWYYAWGRTAWSLGSLIWSCRWITVLPGLLCLHKRVSRVLKHWWSSVAAGGLLKTPIAGPPARVSDSAGLGVGWLRICISHELPGDAMLLPTLRTLDVHIELTNLNGGEVERGLAEESEELVGFQLPCLNALIILTLSNFSKFSSLICRMHVLITKWLQGSNCISESIL